MKVVIGIVLLCTLVVIEAGSHNGIWANIETYPWAVHLLGSNNVECDGSIVSSNFILSSGLCSESTPIKIIFGTQNLSEPIFTRIAIDGQIYKKSNLILIRIDDIPLGLTVQPIRLPKYSEVGHNQRIGEMAYLSGFGITMPPDNQLLQIVHTKIMSHTRCIDFFDSDKFTSHSICAEVARPESSSFTIGNEGAALSILEDDGAPTQIGILVHSSAESISPSIYSSIEYELDWIYDTTDVPFRY